MFEEDNIHIKFSASFQNYYSIKIQIIVAYEIVQLKKHS